MAATFTFFPMSTSLPLHLHRSKRHFPVPPQASRLSLPFNTEHYQREFNASGVSFQAIGDSSVIKMEMENGSKASLMLPNGLVTSYKPQMWHGGAVELLHTAVSEVGDRGFAVRGGVSADFGFAGDSGLRWSPATWALCGIRGSSEEGIEVELKSTAPNSMVEVIHIVSLHEDHLGSELTVTNSSSSPLQMVGSVMTHLTVSSPEATYAVGLQGSGYFSKQPLMTGFAIVPSDFDGEFTSPDSGLSRAWRALQGALNEAEEEEEEEEEDWAVMAEEMSRVYTTAPRQFTVMDRGTRNSVVIHRNGFEELYVFSPGSDHEMYGKYSYLCVGPCATLNPLVLGPGAVWRGALYLHNPNT